jgi:hypothetical protein
MISRKALLIAKLKGRVPEGQEAMHAENIIEGGHILSEVLEFYDDFYSCPNFIGTNDSE